VLECPSNSKDGLGYGMNTFLHGSRPDLVERPQITIVTCDSIDSSTFEGDFKRHAKGCIFSRLDGSAVYAKTPEQGGRFASGRFPMNPTIAADGKPIEGAIYMPKTFQAIAAGQVIADQFLICGPYGDGEGEGTTDALGLLGIDYIGEREYARSTADGAPIIGEIAPESEKIEKPKASDQLSSSTLPPNVIRKWQRGFSGTKDAIESVVLMHEKNYNAFYDKKTTYAGTYIFSPETQDVVLTAVIDDLGKVWVNGGQSPTGESACIIDTKAVPVSSESNTALVTLPAGISFVLMRVTNYSPGAGAKFNLKFDKEVYASYNLP